MNSLSVKAKFQMGQFKNLKQIFCKFVGQSDFKAKVKVTSFQNSPRPSDDQVQMINSYSSKVVAFTMNHTKFLGFKENLTLKVKVTSFPNHTRH